MTMAKGVGNGFPLGVCVTTPGKSVGNFQEYILDLDLFVCVCMS